jgi:cytochrome c oxidase subunit II
VTARVVGIVMAAAAIGCSGIQAPLNPAGPSARSIAWLTWTFFGVCGIVYVAVLIALAAATLRRRRDDDDSPGATRRLETMVGAATAATVVTLVVLTISSIVAGRGLTTPSGAGAVVIDAIGHQWWWEFTYQDVSPGDWVTSPNELHLPAGVPVVIRALSRDVIHSFWVPNLQGKRDLIPGILTYLWLQADRPGEYRGQCAEFCGAQHAHMAFPVVVHPAGEFQQWLRQQRQSAVLPASAEAARGHDVFMSSTCRTCHTIRGTDAGSRVGPDLTHVASRRTIAAGTLPNNRDSLTTWIRNSQLVKPGNRMPPQPLNDADLRAVVAYVEGLR